MRIWWRGMVLSNSTPDILNERTANRSYLFSNLNKIEDVLSHKKQHLLRMFYFSSNWIIFIGIPLIIAMWADPSVVTRSAAREVAGSPYTGGPLPHSKFGPSHSPASTCIQFAAPA